MEKSKEDYINYRIEKAGEALADANLLAKNERWNSCVNRLYYSSFYLVSALLYKHGIKAHSHNGTKTQFFLHFVKEGMISKESGKLFSHLFDWRQESDYADFIEFDGETIFPLLDQVKNFHVELKGLLKPV